MFIVAELHFTYLSSFPTLKQGEKKESTSAHCEFKRKKERKKKNLTQWYHLTRQFNKNLNFPLMLPFFQTNIYAIQLKWLEKNNHWVNI